MVVLYKWENCKFFQKAEKIDLCLAYFIEIHIKELTDEIISILSNEDKDLLNNDRFLDEMNIFVKANPHLGHFDCIYLLISSNIDNAKLFPSYFPIDNKIWKDGKSPFVNMHGIEIFSINELKNMENNILNACIKTKQKTWDFFYELGIDMRINDISEAYVYRTFIKQGKKPILPNEKAVYSFIVDGKRILVKNTDRYSYQTSFWHKQDFIGREWDEVHVVVMKFENGKYHSHMATVSTYDQVINSEGMQEIINFLKKGKENDIIKVRIIGPAEFDDDTLRYLGLDNPRTKM